MKLPLGSQKLPPIQTVQLIADPIEFFRSCSQRSGDAFTVRVMGLKSPPVAFFANPQALKDIFTAPSQKFDFSIATHVFQPLMGDKSIILQSGRSHLRQRQLLMPQFHGDRLQAYGKIICKIADEVTEPIQPGDRICIGQIVPEITLEIILRVVFGINSEDRYQQLKKQLSSLLDDITKPWYSSLFFFPPLQKDFGPWSPWGRFRRRMEQIDNLIYAQIKERRNQKNSSGTDILSLLISAPDENGQSMTDVELRDQLVSLLLLGYETTSAALAWAFYWIHSLPEVLSTLRAELNQLGDSPDPEAIAQLPYLTAVCQETLRIIPIALISMPRMTVEAMEIGGYEVDAGVVVIPCIYLAHQRTEVYPAPETFQPERFLTRKFSAYQYLPFGGGERGCIGAAFSMYEMKLILATMLSRFQVTLAQQRPVKPIRRGITIVPSGGVKMIVNG